MSDWRNIREGNLIVGEGYADQPYVVLTDDGDWLCCVTLSGQIEGSSDQHVATFRSTDQGRTWEKEVRLEAPDAPENSYAVMLKADNGRIYIFYDRNTDNVREVPFHDKSGSFDRVDSLGHYVFRYSDDNGKSWSKDFYDVP
ncbi:MAG: exo-alpha-sialidase, partial [Victivallales bacterium]|nr:exo-alpha-sialidase [Victivallales bacterium]